ncbi:hypothetical protein FOXB_04181 [Fusarium oxysporum f. sp. conglutinans Fo5176]|nr:hypothetical protein FOXB_04181 [Fusarium oxysporum f. sp. conglutinans Fo5176]
MFYKILN